MNSPLRAVVRLYLIIAVFLLGSTSVAAHFKLNLNVRIIHVEHLADGLNVYMRLPMPYLVAHLLGEIDENGLPLPAPYTRNLREGGKLVHYVEVEQLRHSSDGLALLAQQGLNLAVVGESVKLKAERIRIYKNGAQPDFATLDDARQAFQNRQSFNALEQGVYVGDTTVDVLLRYTNQNAVYQYTLASSLNPGLPDQDETANLVLDYSPGGVQVFRARGLLHEPVEVTRSKYDAMATFIVEGMTHILEGLDHVLFVICLVLGAMHFKPLLWRITAFTIGHSITLSIGFFGFIPSSAWFVPTVETGIALSIIYIAIVAIWQDLHPSIKQSRSEWTVIAITAMIGLLHGLGFSFVLHKILQVTSPNIWQSLLAFNLGVEIGQVLVVIVTWLVFYLISLLGDKTTKISRYLVAGISAAVGVIWVIERGNSILLNI